MCFACLLTQNTFRPAVVRRRKVVPEKSDRVETEEEHVLDRGRIGGRRRKKVKVKRRKKKKIGGEALQNGAQASNRWPANTLTKSNPYFKDLNFPSLPPSLEQSGEFSESSGQFSEIRIPSKGPSQEEVISTQAPPLSRTSSRSRHLQPERQIFGSKAPLTFKPAPPKAPSKERRVSSSSQVTPLNLPTVPVQPQLSFNIEEEPRTVLPRARVRLRPSRVLFGHKSPSAVSQEGRKPPEPQFFTNVKIRFKPPQFQPSSPQVNQVPVLFQNPASIHTFQDLSHFQSRHPQTVENSPKSEAQFKNLLLRGFDGSYTINTDL